MSAQHKCPWPFCVQRVDADLWGCRAHWFTIPPELRKALWRAYRPGQTAATASKEYRDAYAAIETWIALYLQTSEQKTRITGHGHVTPQPGGFKARCGGPALCRTCQREAQKLRGQDERQGDLPL